MQPEESLKIIWSDFQTNVANSYQNVWLSQQYSDVTIACEGEGDMIKAHRLVLASGSSFFDQILSRIGEHPQPLVWLAGVMRSDLEVILGFLYYGQVQVSQAALPRVLETARYLGIKGLQAGGDAIEESASLNKAQKQDVFGGEFEPFIDDKVTIDDRDSTDSEISAVWEFAEKVDRDKAQCNICCKTVVGSTQDLMNHVLNLHRNTKEAIKLKKKIEMELDICSQISQSMNILKTMRM